MTSEDDGMPSQGSSGLGASQDSAGTMAREVRSANSVEEATYIARFIKDCPRCFSLCEKEWGCDHVTCPRCGHHFCWRCRADWARSGGYRHLENCSGEARSAPTREQAEEQFQEFMKQHNVATTTESKDSFILDWMRREEEMRTKFEYHREVGPVPGAFGNLLDNHGELLEQRVQRQREEEHRLQEQVLEQRRELELRQRFHVSRALQEKESALRGLPVNTQEHVRQLSDEEFGMYQQIMNQGRKVDHAAKILQDIKAHANDLQPLAEGYSNLAHILLSCERTKWAYLLDRFFNGARRLSEMVDFCMSELDGIEELCNMLELVTAVATDADEGSSSSSSPTPSRVQNHHSCGSLANRAEYYTRKRENFIIAWEVQLERQGESSH